MSDEEYYSDFEEELLSEYEEEDDEGVTQSGGLVEAESETGVSGVRLGVACVFCVREISRGADEARNSRGYWFQ